MLTDHTGKCRGPLAIKIALEAVSNGLVQQDPGPTGPQHHRQGTGRGSHRFKVDQCLAYRLPRITPGTIFFNKETVIGTAATTGTGLLAPPVLFNDNGHIAAHQRAHIGRQRPVADRDHHDFVYTDEADNDFPDAGVLLTRLGIQLFQQRHLVIRRHAVQRVQCRVQQVFLAAVPGLQLAFLAVLGNRTRSRRGLQQCRHHNLVGIGKPGLVATDGTHAGTLLDTVCTFLDDAIFQYPRLKARGLKIQVTTVHGMTQQLPKHLVQVAFIQAGRCQQSLSCDIKVSATHDFSFRHCRRRCSILGKLRRALFNSPSSISAQTTPGPRDRLLSMLPHGSTIMLWP